MAAAVTTHTPPSTPPGATIIPIGGTPPPDHRMNEIFQKNAPPVQPFPKEKCSCRKVMKVVVLVVLFPLGILWIIQKLAAIALFSLGNCIFRCRTGFDLRQFLLPSLTRPADVNAKKKEDFLKDPNNRATALTMTTPDGVTLDGMVLWSEESWNKRHEDPARFNFKDTRWAILYNGNTMLYEDMFDHPYKRDKDGIPIKKDGKHVYDTETTIVEQLREQYQRKPNSDQRDLGKNLIVFNYRGTGNSGIKNGKKVLPNSVNDLILDGHTPIQLLKDKGVQPHNLFIEGVSLGGGISVPSAAHHPGVNVGNINSFRTFPKCIQGIVHDRTSKKTCNCAAKALAWLVRSILHWLLENNSWNWDSETKWSLITGYKRIDTATFDELMFRNYGCLATSEKIGPTTCCIAAVAADKSKRLEKGTISYTIDYVGNHDAVLTPEGIMHRRAYFERIQNEMHLHAEIRLESTGG